MTREELVARLRARRDDYRKVGALVDGAKLCDEVLLDLERLWSEEDQALVPLAGAVQLSGLHERTLRRRVEKGELPACRKGRRLWFRVGDLPLKAGGVDGAESGRYDPVADARQVTARRTHGGSSHEAQEVTRSA